MELRSLLSDIDSAIINNWGTLDTCPCADEIYNLAEVIDHLKPKIKSLKKQKQGLSRAFRDSSLSATEILKLKEDMQIFSVDLKQLENKRKNHEKKLLSLFNKTSLQADFPIRFMHETTESIDKVIHVKIVSDDFSATWDGYVSKHPQASIYHLYNWRHVIKNSFNHHGMYLAAIDESGHCRGVLPLIKLSSRLFGTFTVSMPYFNYGGPIADSNEIEKTLLEFAATQNLQQPIQYLEIRATKNLNDWPKKTDKVSMILSLPEEQSQLDKQLGTKLRAQINQAKNHDLQVKLGSIELLNDFYTVFAENMRDLGTPVYSKKFFSNIFTAFASQASLAIIYSNKKPISAAFLIGYRDMLEIPWASTLKSHNKMNANMLLYRTVLGYAIDSGYQYFDFGRSSMNANTYRFKKQWGAKAQQHQWHYCLAEGKPLPGLNPDNPKFNLLIRVWKKIPVVITRLIGPSIVKNLP